MPPPPTVAAIDMGYGHLRPASALAAELAASVGELDRSPLGDAEDLRFWNRIRRFYEPLTRLSQVPLIGPPLKAALGAITHIPSPWPPRDLSRPTQGTRWMERAARAGVGARLAGELRRTGAPLVSTFYAGAILPELHGVRDGLSCVVTDSDVNRVWAPPRPAQSRIVYFAPSERIVRRLVSYGVAEGRVLLTGYPLPGELLGGRELPALRANLRARLCRLDPRGVFLKAAGEEVRRELGPLEPSGEPPLVVFAVGGAGAQVPLARRLVPGMAARIRDGRLRLALVAGRRPEVARALRAAVAQAGLADHPGCEVLASPDVWTYFRDFHALLARADVLWSKPSEMTFFAGLGLPFLSAPPVGAHEQWNLLWARERGAALVQHDPAVAGEWLCEWLDDGVLAGAAWAGYRRLPNRGLYAIADRVRAG